MKNEFMARALKTLRIANDFTTRMVAEKMNVRTSYITDCERGDRTPSIATLDKYALALGVSTADIIEVREYAKNHT